METAYRSRYYQGISKCAKPDLHPDEEYDIAILVSGWEHRSAAVTGLRMRCHRCLVIRLEQDGLPFYRDEYDQAVRRYASGISRRVENISGSFSEDNGLQSALHNVVISTCREVGRPARVLFDITNCPKYAFLEFLSFCFHRGLCKELCFCYAEGIYRHTHRSDREYVFTYGNWDSVIVPGFLGAPNPEKRRYFLVAVGFEGEQALRLVSRHEPDRVSLLVPEPGFTPAYTRKAREHANLLVEEYRIPPNQIISAAAGDAILAWQNLSTAGIYRDNTEETAFLCLGTKPHALAMGLAALDRPDSILLCNRPERYELMEATFNDRLWTYTITDLTSF